MRRQPRPIVGARGEHERAAAVVLVEQPLHARLGGARHAEAIEQQPAQAALAGQPLDGAAVNTRV